MDRRVQKTKTAIQEAYFGLLNEKKDGKIKISDIAKKADIDRKTFYLHYESIDGILDEFCDSRVQILMEQLKERNFYENPLHLEMIFEVITKMLEENIAAYRILAENVHGLRFWMQIQQIMTEALVQFYKNLVSVPENKLRVYVDFFIVGTIQIYIKWLADPERVPLERMSEIVVDLARNGIMHLIVADPKA